MADTYNYEKIDENYEKTICPSNDLAGKYTGGVCVLNLKAWFDENPEMRKQLGWIKHIHPDKSNLEFNTLNQYIQTSTEKVDEYTIRDVYTVVDKSEDLLELEEICGTTDFGGIYNFVWDGAY